MATGGPACRTSIVCSSGRVLVAAGLNVGQLSSAERFSGANGDACAAAAFCLSGFCVDGVCCGSACSAGVCDACSVAAGAAVNGTCALLTGPSCNDGSVCTQTDTCQAGVCTGGNPIQCLPSDQCHDAGTCNPATGACSNPPKPNGSGCNDGDACTQIDSCQFGVCAGANPVVCFAQDVCHDAGTCNPATGACSNPPKPNGTTCNDGDACTQIDTCQSGACTAGTPIVCPAPDQCHDPGTCNPATGICSNPAKPSGTACNDGNACTQTDTCQAGACAGANPVQCAPSDACHDAGTCNPATGACSNPPKPNGSGCNDGDGCTQVDTCQSGVCTGGAPVTCFAQDACHDAGTCNPATGACSNPPKPDGSVCNDGDGCTQVDTCQSGACTAGTPVVCPAPDQCHDAGTCDPATGTCSNPAKPSGAACDDGNACTQTDMCQAGSCLGANIVQCAPSDACHDPGVCDPATGACSNPSKPNGAACDDGDPCSQADTCQSGACTAGDPVVCAPQDDCHLAGTCQSDGQCDSPAAPDGTPCSIGGSAGVCEAGVCEASSSTTTGAGGSGASGGPGGSGASGGSGGSGAPETGGCGCRAAGDPTGSREGSWLLAGLAALAAARRRRTPRRPALPPC